MTVTTVAPVLAAGAVCWRRRGERIEVLLISRSRHNDVSLPKGKVDGDESLPETAVREIREETGFEVHLGLPLGSTEYVLPNGRDKTVYYWAAEVPQAELERGRFRPNDEVDRLDWVPVTKAGKLLSYSRDVEVLQRFAASAAAGDLGGFRLVVLRHGKAAFDSSSGRDADRELTSRGEAQAKAVAPGLLAWGPRVIVSSPAARCLATVAPLAKALEVTVKKNASISQDGWEASGHDPKAIREFVARRVAKGRTAVLCSHAPVLPELMEQLARVTGSPNGGRMTRAGILATAEYTVLHLSPTAPHAILAMETHAAAG